MIIGISGYARHGKDSVCEEFVDILGESGSVRVARYALADPLKVCVNKFMGWGKREAYGKNKEVTLEVKTSYRVIQKALDLHINPYLDGNKAQAEDFINLLKGAGVENFTRKLQRTTEITLKISPRRAYQIFGTEFIRKLDNSFWFKLAEKYQQDNQLDFLIIPDIRFNNEYDWVVTKGVCVGVHRPNMSDNGVGTQHTSEKDIEGILSRCERTVINSGTLKDLRVKCQEILEWIYSLRG